MPKYDPNAKGSEGLDRTQRLEKHAADSPTLTPAASTDNVVQPSSDGVVGFVVKRPSSVSTADLIQFQDETGARLGGVDYTGATSGSLTPPGNTVMFAGDSLTARGVAGSGVFTQNEIAANSWTMWASLLSQGRIRWGGVAATVGYTTAQILATHIPTVVAAKPAAAVVLGGTNDADQGVAIATTIANLTASYKALQNAGIVPICATIPPIQSSTTAVKKTISEINGWIKAYAASHGYACIDFYSHLVDATTGEWISGLNTDNYHPTNAGAKIMGQLACDVLCGTSFLTLRQTDPGYFSAGGPWLPAYNSDPTNLFSNGLMLNSSGGRPTGWSMNGTPSTETVGSDATTLGNYYNLTGAAGNPHPSITASAAAAAGDVIEVCARLGAVSMVANSAQWTFRVCSSDQVQDYIKLDTWDQDLALGSVLVYRFTMPGNDGSNRTVRAYLWAMTAAGVASVGQIACRNLTALGIA